MISFKDALKILEKSSEFKKWKNKNKSNYLSYAFYVIDNEDVNWKIGYYDSKKEKLTSFDVGSKIKIEPDEEVFQEKKRKVEKLDLKKIKLDLSEAITISKQLQEEEFATENPTKIIAILLEFQLIMNMYFVMGINCEVLKEMLNSSAIPMMTLEGIGQVETWWA